jgi:hypothetical protein
MYRFCYRQGKWNKAAGGRIRTNDRLGELKDSQLQKVRQKDGLELLTLERAKILEFCIFMGRFCVFLQRLNERFQ